MRLFSLVAVIAISVTPSLAAELGLAKKPVSNPDASANVSLSEPAQMPATADFAVSSDPAPIDELMQLEKKKRVDQRYRNLVAKGLTAELRRIGCYQEEVGQLYGPEFNAALGRYFDQSGHRFDSSEARSVLLRELMSRQNGYCGAGEASLQNAVVVSNKSAASPYKRIIMVDSAKPSVHKSFPDVEASQAFIQNDDTNVPNADFIVPRVRGSSY